MVRILWLGILMALACAQPGFAQSSPHPIAQEDDREDGHVLRTTLSGFDLVLPVPLWIKPDRPALEQITASATTPRPGIAALTFRNIEENLVLWTQLTGVLAVKLPSYTAAIAFKNIAEPLALRCRPGQYEFFWVPPLEGQTREALVGLCGDYRLEARNAQTCDAGLVVAIAMESAEGVVSVYHEWCAKSYDVKNRARWPASEDELTSIAKNLQTLSDFQVAKK